MHYKLGDRTFMVQKFTIMTDHHPLKYLDTQKTLSKKQARWVEFMQEFNYSINYIKGKSSIVADALSRKNKTAHHKSTEIVRKITLHYSSEDQ